MRKKGSMKSRFLSIVMAAALVVTGTVPSGLPKEVNAAETAASGNALKAIGINSDVAPDGFDEDDTEANPYGKKTVVGTVSDEVYVSQVGEDGSAIIGNERLAPTGSTYSYYNSGSKKYLLTYKDNIVYDEFGRSYLGTSYISDIAVAGYTGKEASAKAKKALTDRGFTVIMNENTEMDLNGNAGGYYIYMGYKTTTDPSEAITNIILGVDFGYEKLGVAYPPSTLEFQDKDYTIVTAYGQQDFIDAKGELNMGTNKHTHAIFAYYTKDKYRSYDRTDTLITALFANKNKNEEDGVMGFICEDEDYDEDDLKINKCDDFNRGAAGYSIYMHMNTVQVNFSKVEGTVKTSANPDAVKNASMNKTASGNFDGNEEGKKSQFAMVSSTSTGGLNLSVVDAVNQHASKSKILTSSIPDSDNLSEFCTNAAANGQSYDSSSLKAIASMSIVTGDFDSNGIDEIAVFNPKSSTGERVEVYSLKTSPSKCDIYDMTSWEIKTSIATSGKGIVSLDAGDLNQDGIDDLVVGCDTQVYVYSGASTSTLSEKTAIDMTFGGSVNDSIIDPSVTIFREKVSGKMNTYLGILTKSGISNGYRSVTGYLNVLKFDGEKKRFENITGTTMALSSVYTTNASGANYHMLRLPMELYYVNHRFMTPYISTNDNKAVYFSEEQLSYVSAGNANLYQKNDRINYIGSTDTSKKADVIPYDFQVADLNGTGVQTAFYKTYFTGYTNYSADNISYYFNVGNYLGATSPGTDGANMPLGFSSNSSRGVVYAVLNTDDDTAYMNYTGRHYFDYSDPEVLAVLASPPYFKDLLANDNLSGNYAESTTSYGKSEGSGESASGSATISAGVYTKFEQEVSALGLVTVAQFETELSVTANFTTEYEQASEMEYSVAYSTSSGADAVVFYSIPTEIYEYETTYVDKKTGKNTTYKKQIYFPKEPCVATIELNKYKAIRENYSELPEIDESIMSHKLGYPETYPSSSGKYKKVKEFKGNWMAVDFTNAGGGITQEQSIAMSKESETAFSSGVEMSFSAGGGAGGVSVGFTVGSNLEAGYAMTSTSGNSYTASMQNMPAEAEEYGYGMSWKLFAHEGSYVNKNGNTVKFPVVDYMVTDVMAPPSVPEEFRQNYFASTQNSIALEWEYEEPKKAESFNIYRVTNINGRKTTILAGVIGTAAGVKEDGTYKYTFTDDGTNDDGSKIMLEPGVEYDYYIEATRSLDAPPSLSMPSETISAYTRSDAEYPVISLKGIKDNKLTVFPDRSYDIEVKVDNKDSFTQISYQWQKYDNKKGWTDIKGKKTNIFSIDEATADISGEYRCCVDAVFYNEELQKQSVVSTYTDTMTITYKMRSVDVVSMSVTSKDMKPEVEITLKPTNPACLVNPSGNVKIILEKDSVQKIYNAELKAGKGKTATAKLSGTEVLEAGNYKVTAFYGGDDIFGSYTSEVHNLIIGESTIYPVITNVNGKITNTFTYGDTMRIDFYRYTKDETGATVEEKLVDKTNVGGFNKKLLVVPGTYNDTISASFEGVDGVKTFNYSYTVQKRPVEIGISKKILSVGDVAGKLPVPVLMEDNYLADAKDSLNDLVTLRFMNSTKTQYVTLDNNTPIGTYYAELTAKDTVKAKCYDMDLYSSEIRIGAKLYNVNIESEKCDGNEAGTIIMSKPEEISDIKSTTLAYEAGAKLRLRTKAKTGYIFDHWEIKEGDETTTSTDSILVRNILPTETSIKAVFVSNCYTVTLDESNSNGGKIKLPDGFESGKEYQVGTVLRFTELDGEDVVSNYWVKVVSGRTSIIPGAELTLTVPEADVTLYPIFQGKPCKVEIGDGVIAEYTYVDDQDDTITQRIKNGDFVPKNSVINLRVGNRFAHYMWFVNGKEIERNKDTSFTLSGDTKIELRPIEVANKPASKITVYSDIKKISDVKLPDNWVWATEDMNKVLVLDKEVTATAIYAGIDKGSYENETVEIRVLQIQCEHKNKEIKNALDATTDKEGYTGDTYCMDCGELILKGKVISKLSNDVKVTGVGTISADGKTLTDLDGKKYLVSEKLGKEEIKKNTLVADKRSQGKYKITKVVKKNGKVVDGEVTYMKPYNKNCKIISATGVVKLAGVKFKVTAIAPNCAKDCKNLKTVVLGSYVTNIGKNAFRGCSNLKSITIKGKSLKKVGANAFKGINKKAVIKVPKNKKTAYTKLLKGKGQAKTVKIK